MSKESLAWAALSKNEKDFILSNITSFKNNNEFRNRAINHGLLDGFFSGNQIKSIKYWLRKYGLV